MNNEKPIVYIQNDSLNPVPIRVHPDDACFDLRADFSKGVNSNMLFKSEWNLEKNCLILYPGGRCIVPVNIATAFDKSYMMKIMQRSGLAIKNGILAFGGVIDSNYRNYWGVILYNLSDQIFLINQGDRIAQAALIKTEDFDWKEVDNLEETDRNKSGFGASGVK